MFDSVTKGATVALDKPFKRTLRQVARDHTGGWGNNGKAVRNVLRDAKDASKRGFLSGEEYGRITSQLGKMARQKLRGENSDPDAAFALFRVKDALDDAMERSLGSDARAAFQTARGQYKNLMHLEAGAVTDAAGDVSLVRLASQLKRKDRNGFTRGKNKSDLYEAARVGRAFFPESFGRSGTPERLSPWIIGGTGLGVGTVDPMMGVLAAGGLAAGANLGARAYGAATPYLTNTLLSPARRLSVQGQTGRLGTGLLLSGPESVFPSILGQSSAQ